LFVSVKFIGGRSQKTAGCSLRSILAHYFLPINWALSAKGYPVPKLENQFQLDSCPHCSVNRPSLMITTKFETVTHNNTNKRLWVSYACKSCGGAVIACASKWNMEATEIYPSSITVDDAIPNKAKEFLKQAIATIHAPAGSVMLSASAVDAMLKEKDYIDGSLYKRIENAVNDNLITEAMAKWAHEVRLDANDQRHADVAAELPNESDAQRIVEFTQALAEFLFVLPAKVQRGIEQAHV